MNNENLCEEIANMFDDEMIEHTDNCEVCIDYYNTRAKSI